MNEERTHSDDQTVKTDRGELQAFALDPQGERTKTGDCQTSRSQLTPQLHPQFAKRVFTDPLTTFQGHPPKHS